MTGGRAGTSEPPAAGRIDVRLERDVAVVVLNRPEKLNALTRAMRLELAATIRDVGDGSRARGVVVTGAGRAFSAGEDLAEGAEDDADGVEATIEQFHDLTRAVLDTRVPVVGALNGLAVGGASELTLAFDARVGTRAAGYFLPENRLGLSISNAASHLLFRLLRGRDALRLVLEARRLDAAEALAIGLLDDVVDGEDAVPAAVELVRSWTEPGMTTQAHLGLLRPDREAVERAMRRETAAARRAWDAGLWQRGIERFWAGRD